LGTSAVALNQVAILDRTIQADPSALFARCSRGAHLASVGEFDKAEKDFALVEKRSPEYRWWHYWRSFLFLAQDKREAAVTSMNKALDISSGMADALATMPSFRSLRDDPRTKWPASFKKPTTPP
jgi:tetratricopeptide (TPR) repeat protein